MLLHAFVSDAKFTRLGIIFDYRERTLEKVKLPNTFSSICFYLSK